MTDATKTKVLKEKTPSKVSRVVKKEKKEEPTTMFFAVGRRKNAIARIRLTEGDGSIVVNEKSYKDYFPLYELQKTIEAPLAAISRLGSTTISVKVNGGGFRGQAEAIRHGIARALVSMDGELRKTMRGLGYLTRDSRIKERKKPGLKRARRAPQFSKR